MAEARRIRILIADDHPVFRMGLRIAIEQAADLESVADASSGLETLDNVEHFNPDVAIIDLSMPDLSGIQVLQQIRRGNTQIGILILTAHDSEEYFHAAMDAGANGYLFKGQRIHGNRGGHPRRS